MVLALLLAASIWPADAQVKSRKVDSTVEIRSVSITRLCSEFDDQRAEFAFEYPHYRGHGRAVRAINDAIETSLDLKKALADCPVPSPGWQGDIMFGRSVVCDVGTRHGSILTVQCTRGWESRGRTGGYDDFLLFDMASGRELQTTDLIDDMPHFRQLIRQQLLDTYKADLGGDDDPEGVVQELTGNLSRNCGLVKERLSCSALMGAHNYFDVSFDLRSLCPLLKRPWFAADCATAAR